VPGRLRPRSVLQSSLRLMRMASCFVLLQSKLASAASTPTRAEINPESGSAHPFCVSRLVIGDLGSARTLEGIPDAEFLIRGELWVGAEFNSGSGEQIQVSSLVDFSPIENWPISLEVAYADTAEGLVTHTPLGIQVRQHSRGIPSPSPEGQVLIRFVVTNISAEWRPPGWSLGNVYFGIVADIDLGQQLPEGQDYWSDDQGAFASTSFGEVGYMWDQNGGEDAEDDVAARVGILLPEDSVHSFQLFSAGQPWTESEQYLLMRGDSHASPTIDPPSIRPNDYRILLAAGPFQIAKGQSKSFSALYICDDALETREWIPRVSRADPFSRQSHTLIARPENVVFDSLPLGGRISIYSVTGKHLADLHSNGSQARWIHAQEAAASSGIYFYRRIVLGEETRIGRVILVR